MAAPPPLLPRTPWPAALAVALGGVSIAMNVGKVPLALPQWRYELGLRLV